MAYQFFFFKPFDFSWLAWIRKIYVWRKCQRVAKRRLNVAVLSHSFYWRLQDLSFANNLRVDYLTMINIKAPINNSRISYSVIPDTLLEFPIRKRQFVNAYFVLIKKSPIYLGFVRYLRKISYLIITDFATKLQVLLLCFFKSWVYISMLQNIAELRQDAWTAW